MADVNDQNNGVVGEENEASNVVEENGKTKKKRNPVVWVINGIGKIHGWCKDKISKHPTGGSIVVFGIGTVAGYALSGLVTLVSGEISKLEDEEESDLLDNNLEDDATAQIEEQAVMETPTED